MDSAHVLKGKNTNKNYNITMSTVYNKYTLILSLYIYIYKLKLKFWGYPIDELK
jgi:hypothetical protein